MPGDGFHVCRWSTGKVASKRAAEGDLRSDWASGACTRAHSHEEVERGPGFRVGLVCLLRVIAVCAVNLSDLELRTSSLRRSLASYHASVTSTGPAKNCSAAFCTPHA